MAYLLGNVVVPLSIPHPRRPFTPRFAPSSSSSSSPTKNAFLGMALAVEGCTGKSPINTLSFVKAKNIWWKKEVQQNMKEITSAGDLVNSLLNAGDKLVIVDFFSPGCAGCKSLHPKICQLAEKHQDVLFLQINHEEHKSVCHTLNVHVLPFFRFYRGAHGRLCSFSCTNATIKKFKDALAKHNTERCSLGPAKGLDEREMLALTANKELCFGYLSNVAGEMEDKALAPAGR